jgi:DedD protein
VLTNVAKTPVSDEELQLKKKARRRLVGAVVLVLLVVVFVPMFLDREPRPQKQDIDIRIPPIPGQAQSPQPQGLPPAIQDAPAVPPAAAPDKSLAPDTSNTPKAPVASAPAPDNTSAPPAAAVEGAATSTADPASNAERNAAEPTRKAEAKGTESFVIQVGAFSDPGNARHLVEKLKAEKIPAYTEAVKTSQGEKMRVRAGPYPTLAAAEHGRSRLKTLKLLPASGDAKIVHKGE